MSDRALRKLAAKLSRNRQEDVDAVLAALDPVQRARITVLLSEHPVAAEGLPGKPTPRPIRPGPANLDDLSPWLAARIKAATGESEDRVSLGPAARDALRALAAAPPSSKGKARKRAADLLCSVAARIRGIAA